MKQHQLQHTLQNQLSPSYYAMHKVSVNSQESRLRSRKGSQQSSTRDAHSSLTIEFPSQVQIRKMLQNKKLTQQVGIGPQNEEKEMFQQLQASKVRSESNDIKNEQPSKLQKKINQSLFNLSKVQLQQVNSKLGKETKEVSKTLSPFLMSRIRDINTIFIKKFNLSKKQKLQITYYQTLLKLMHSTRPLLEEKLSFKRIRHNMNSIIYCALLTQDPQILKIGHLTFGYICFILRQFTEAKRQFKYLKDICEDVKDYQTKMIAYKMLGTCYKHLYRYKVAANCFKKMVQVAWDVGSQEAELQAYDQLGLIYYYNGDLKKAKYYTERATRGWTESDDSHIKKLQKRDIQTKRSRKEHHFGLPNLETVFEKFKELTQSIIQNVEKQLEKVDENIKEQFDVRSFASDSSIQIENLEGTITVSDELILEDTAEVYRHFLLGKQSGIAIRPGSLVSQNSNDSVPSPKGILSNVKSLPHFTDTFDKEHFEKKQFVHEDLKKKPYKDLPYEIFKTINPRLKCKEELPCEVYYQDKLRFQERFSQRSELKKKKLKSASQSTYMSYQDIRDNQVRSRSDEKWRNCNYLVYSHMNPFRITQIAQKSSTLQNSKFMKKQFNNMEYYLKKELSTKTFKEARIGELTQQDILAMVADPEAVQLKDVYLKPNNEAYQKLNDKLKGALKSMMPSYGTQNRRNADSGSTFKHFHTFKHPHTQQNSKHPFMSYN